MFVRSNRGTTQVAVSALVSMVYEDGGWIAQDSLGKTHAISNMDWGLALDAITQSTFPAAPGTSVLCLTDDEGTGGIDRTGVLAWRIDGHGNARPVTFDTLADTGDEDLPVEIPGGQVITPDGTRYPTALAWRDRDVKTG